MMNCLQGLSPIRACSLLTSIDGPKRAFVGGTRAGPVLCTADALCPDVTTSGYIIPNPFFPPPVRSRSPGMKLLGNVARHQ